MAERAGFESNSFNIKDLEGLGQGVTQPGIGQADTGQAPLDTTQGENGEVTPETPSRTLPGQLECQISAKRETAPIDPDLVTVTDAWANLPDAIKAGITAMVKASIGL